MSDLKNGDVVKFKVGRSGTEYTAKVTGRDGMFVLTVDAEGKARKVRPSACKSA